MLQKDVKITVERGEEEEEARKEVKGSREKTSNGKITRFKHIMMHLKRVEIRSVC